MERCQDVWNGGWPDGFLWTFTLAYALIYIGRLGLPSNTANLFNPVVSEGWHRPRKGWEGAFNWQDVTWTGFMCVEEISDMEIEMKIRTIMMDPDANTPVVVLKDVNGDAMLPIWIGAFEANAIAVEIEKTASPRPTTHDLMKNIIRELGVTVRRIIITDLVDNTFFAVIEMGRDGEVMMIDSRPSDAIALALRVDCPIYVDQQVINSSASAAVEEPSGTGEDDWPDDLIDDATHYKM